MPLTVTMRLLTTPLVWYCSFAGLVAIAASSSNDENVTTATDGDKTCRLDDSVGSGSCADAYHEQVVDEAGSNRKDVSTNKDELVPLQCSLYYAPSTIPGAGWGLYTGKDLHMGDPVGIHENGDAVSDILIPILDDYKTLPYRGQQKFLSWLAYVWPEEPNTFFPSREFAFPKIEPGQFKVASGDMGFNLATSVKFYYHFEDTDAPVNDAPKDGRPRPVRMNAFAPGVGSQANSDEEWDNIYFSSKTLYEGFDDDENIRARSRYHHKGFEAKEDVRAGSELFLWYGKRYHKHLRSVQRTSDKGFETVEDYMERFDFSNLPTERDKRNLMNTTSMRLRTDLKFDAREGKLGAVEMKPKTFDKKIPKPSPKRPSHSLEWLSTHGVCLDNLVARKSNIPSAGMGAFAARSFFSGEVVSHTPLLHLKRDDLVIYGINDVKNKVKKQKSSLLLNFNKVEGHELLMNYCFGHPESEMLLVPYGPVVNYINHDGETPNTMIRWVDGASQYFDLHPIDVLEKDGGTLHMEYVALREIKEGEEITIDYGVAWERAWQDFQESKKGLDKVESSKLSFRHEIGVPDGFYPDKWLHTSVKYELEPKGELKPGELKCLLWKHNGKPVTERFAYLIGLPKGFSEKMKEYSEDIGILPLYADLLKTKLLGSDEWFAFNATRSSNGSNAGEWFAQRYKSGAWGFNMHYVAAWNEFARKNFLGEMGRAGFDLAMDGIGTAFGLDSLTCFHASYMGVSECDTSFLHTDVYATGDVSYNIIWPIELVEGSKPELNVLADDSNTVIAVKYEYDTAILMGDWGYHYTSAIDGYMEGQKRVVVGLYCGQIDERNLKMAAHIYDGEDPAPFMGQFHLPVEYHWSKGNKEEHRMSRL